MIDDYSEILRSLSEIKTESQLIRKHCQNVKIAKEEIEKRIIIKTQEKDSQFN